MKRITYLAAAVALALNALPALGADESFTGSVKAVSGSAITVERGSITGVFAFDAKTHVSAKGASTKTRENVAAGKAGLTVPDAVHVGDQVTVRYFEQGKGMTASDIVVRASLAAK